MQKGNNVVCEDGCVGARILVGAIDGAHQGELITFSLQKGGLNGVIVIRIGSIEGKDIPTVMVVGSTFGPIPVHKTWSLGLRSLTHESLYSKTYNVEMKKWQKELHTALRWACDVELSVRRLCEIYSSMEVLEVGAKPVTVASEDEVLHVG